MITGKLRSDIDKLWEEFWTGGITNPLTVIEQISFLMFARMLDINETREEKKAQRTKKKDWPRIFPKDKQNLRWGNVKELGGAEMLPLVQGGKTDHVFFYNVQQDGFSLDDKRTPASEERTALGPVKGNDLPDCVERWKKRNAKKDTDRTSKCFFVPAEEIRKQKYDLSFNRYKEVVYEEVEYESLKKILKKLRKLEAEIAKDLDELEAML